MKSILNLDESLDPKEISHIFEAYHLHLQSLKDKLPPVAFAFATADWHYNTDDHRCPHDSWVESMVIKELFSGEHRENRSIEIRVQLLGAYHDGYLNINYKQVKSYFFSTPFEFIKPPLDVGHGDWLIDEIRESDQGFVIHEIKFSRGSRWIIEFVDMEYQWQPFE